MKDNIESIEEAIKKDINKLSKEIESKKVFLNWIDSYSNNKINLNKEYLMRKKSKEDPYVNL